MSAADRQEPPTWGTPAEEFRAMAKDAIAMGRPDFAQIIRYYVKPRSGVDSVMRHHEWLDGVDECAAGLAALWAEAAGLPDSLSATQDEQSRPSIPTPTTGEAETAGAALVTATCFECAADLHGPYCPKCNPEMACAGELLEALQEAASWFDAYADEHLAKGSAEKALRNKTRANILRTAIAKATGS